MLISIFTPSHISTWLPDLYESLKKQTHEDRERVVLLNNWAQYKNDDPRVKIFQDTYDGPNKGFVGRLKLEACKVCTGEWLVECDHDDILTPDCLEEIAKVPEGYAFAYGNTVNVERPSLKPVTRWNYYGWTGRPYKFMEADVVEMISASPFPQSISRIRFAPNHPRARRRKDYFEIGWHNPDMKISDDHDLIQRTYLFWKLYHIDKPLYIYRIRGDNTRQKNAEEIQITMRQCHDKYFEKMMMKWSHENELMVVDLGWAIGAPSLYTKIDRHNADLNMDLNEKRNLQDNSVGLMRCHHIFEHLKDPIHVMNEAYRVLAHGWIMDIEIPSDSPMLINGKFYPATGNKSDPTHITSRNSRSFRYYTEPNVRRYIEPECECKFTIIKPAEEILKFDKVPCVKIQLMADKGGHRFYGANNRRNYIDK